jgi:hypothetical protein
MFTRILCTAAIVAQAAAFMPTSSMGMASAPALRGAVSGNSLLPRLVLPRIATQRKLSRAWGVFWDPHGCRRLPICIFEHYPKQTVAGAVRHRASYSVRARDAASCHCCCCAPCLTSLAQACAARAPPPSAWWIGPSRRRSTPAPVSSPSLWIGQLSSRRVVDPILTVSGKSSSDAR